MYVNKVRRDSKIERIKLDNNQIYVDKQYII